MNAVPSRTNDPTGRRNRILDAAAHLFQAHGYAATSMQDVMAAASVTAGALHHHFSTKKAIALSVIGERVSVELGETWVQTVKSAPNAAKGIIRVFEAVAAGLASRHSISGCPLGNLANELALSDEDLRSTMGREYAIWRGGIAEKIRDDAERGGASYGRNDPEGFAAVVVSLFTGAMTMGKVEQRPDALRASSRHLAEFMAADLR